MNVSKEEFVKTYLRRNDSDVESKLVDECQRLHGIDIREDLKQIIDDEYKAFVKHGPGYWKKDESDQT